jgi:hypothetical protein
LTLRALRIVVGATLGGLVLIMLFLPYVSLDGWRFYPLQYVSTMASAGLTGKTIDTVRISGTKNSGRGVCVWSQGATLQPARTGPVELEQVAVNDNSCIEIMLARRPG